MFISPKVAYENGWITGLINPEKQIGSDGIDLTLKRVSRIDTGATSTITEDKKFTAHRPIVVMQPEVADGWDIVPDGMVGYVLPGGVYDIEFNEYVKLPQGVAARLMLRSSLVRAGHSMQSGLYDQGFENFAGAVLHVKGTELFIEQNVRTAQIVFIQSEGSGQLYAGGYNFKEGDATWQDAAERTGATVQ